MLVFDIILTRSMLFYLFYTFLRFSLQEVSLETIDLISVSNALVFFLARPYKDAALSEYDTYKNSYSKVITSFFQNSSVIMEYAEFMVYSCFYFIAFFGLQVLHFYLKNTQLTLWRLLDLTGFLV